jgi:Kef-type K+ transport system membrane component KefB
MLYDTYLYDLGRILVGAVLFALLALKVRMPSIVAYMLAGLALGPVTGWMEMTESLQIISEAGIALLLFLVGLELSFERIRDVGPVALAAGLGQVVFTAIIGYGFAWALGFTPMESLFLATGLTFSSTVVVVKLLDQKKELNSLYGRIAVGIFLVQDLVVIVVLTFLSGLGTGESLTLISVARGLGLSFGGMLGMLAVMLLAARYVLPKPYAWAARSRETHFIWSLAWCFLIVGTAHALHLSVEIGAFLAGISLAQLPFSEDLRRRVHPLMNFFIAVFFVSLGIRMEFGDVQQHLGAALALSLFVLIGNPFIFMWIIAKMGYSEKTAFKTSVTVAQISEFSFIFAAMGVATGLVGSGILAVTALVGILTIAISSYMILYSDPLYAWCKRIGLLRLFRAGSNDPKGETPPAERAGHVLVIGMNALGRRIATLLHEQGERVLALDVDPGKLSGLPCECMMGNVEYPSVLEEAHVREARMVVSALQIEDTNHLLAHVCRAHNVPCAIHAFDVSVIDDLVDLGVNYLMFPRVDGLKDQNQELRKLGVLPT